nr:trigger factor-like isoform X2 [Ipomoea batatas]
MQITGQVQCKDILVPCNSFGRKFLALRVQYDSLRICPNFPAVQAVTSGLEDAEVSTVQYEEFSVSTSVTDSSNELKITVDVSGSKTQEIFDDVFSKMVAEAPPIPGFRRVKGGNISLSIYTSEFFAFFRGNSINIFLILTLYVIFVSAMMFFCK